jgi:hypothetical protein
MVRLLVKGNGLCSKAYITSGGASTGLPARSAVSEP